MPCFTMLCGVPASGKSRFARFFLEANPDTVLISSDACIEEIARTEGLSYQQSYAAHAAEVADLIRERAIMAMDRDLDVLWDQTNLTPQKRADILALVPAHYRRIAMAFEAPQAVLAERLAQREQSNPREIPASVLAAQQAIYLRPDTSEGFDEVRLTRAPQFHLQAPA